MYLRIGAVILRFYYLHRRSPARIMEIFFWPVMNLLVWGFVTRYIGRFTLSETVLFLIGSVILWDVLYRSQQGITFSITEEFWVKNILNLFVAPIRTAELIGGLCLVGVLKTLITTLFLAVLAFLFYRFDLLDLGPALIPFLGNLLLFGWAMGLFTMGLIFRYGRAAEALIWGMPFLIQPVSAVFYPVSVLPSWMQKIAWLLPSTYVFEGMRHTLATGRADGAMLAASFAMNLLYLLIAGIFFGWILVKVRERGYLARLNME